jgi:3-dehydroquinate synthetase
MELELPEGFPTRVRVEEAPRAEFLPSGPWTLVGDRAVMATWRSNGMPEPPGALWVPVTEPGKRLAALVPWLEDWARIPLDRRATVVAVGGGVLTDMAGLAAALYMRGIAWQAWPTTLLSQVDAGLGGKTAVDLEAGKNLAGAFHPPADLVVCRSFLATLPARQLDAGRWEMVKMALVEGDLDWAGDLLGETGVPGSGSLLRALRAKALIVARDPREAGERRLLNLGHTLGHALEAASNYQLLHGEAVGLGTLAACCLAEDQGLPPFPAAFLARTAARLRPLADLVPPWEACLELLPRDKKSGVDWQNPARSAIHCILPRPRGLAEQRLLPPEAWGPAYRRMIDLLH